MGQAYTALVGAPPLPTKFAFRDWFLNLLAIRINNCPVLRTTNYFFTQSGNDSNDGRDSFGFNVSGGSWNPSTFTLTKTGAFTGYSAGAGTVPGSGKGDLVYISGGTGVTAGLYEIASATANTLVLKTSIASTSPTDVTTSNGPQKTLAQAATLVAANVGLFFKRGDVWRESGGAQAGILVQNVNNVTLGDYGSSLKNPQWTRFTKTYANVWTQAGVTNRYTVAEASNIGWLRFQNDQTTPSTTLQKLNSTAAVEAQIYSWYWDGTTLHVNVGGASAPFGAGGTVGGGPNNSPNYLEATLTNAIAGWWLVSSDGSRVQNIRCDGWGLSTSAANYGVKVESSNHSEALVIGCECYYGGYHLMGHTEPTGATVAGTCTYVNCKTGWAAVQGGGSGNWIAFTGATAMETVWYGCEAVTCALPDYTWYNVATKPRFGGAQYAHGTQGALTHALVIVWEMEVKDNPYGAGFGDGCDSTTVPQATTIDQVRAFFVGERAVAWQPWTSMHLHESNMLFLNCYYEVRPVSGSDPTSQGWSTVTCNGWVINTTVRWDCVNQGTGGAGFFYQNQPHKPMVWHCQYEWLNCPSYTGILNPSFDPATYAPSATLFNSIITNTGAFQSGSMFSSVNFQNLAANLGGNAYFGVSRRTGTGVGSGYDQDPAKVEVPLSQPTGSRPLPVSSLYHAGTTLPGGYRLEFDSTWAARYTPGTLSTATPTIGPTADPVDPQPVYTTLTVAAPAPPVPAPPNTVNVFLKANDNWRSWDNTELITYTSHRTSGALDAILANVTAKRRAPTNKELAASQGVYTGQDLVWLVPQANLANLALSKGPGPLVKPADTITDAAGNVWTALEVNFNTLQSTWRLMTRDLAIAYDLQDFVDVQRYTLTYDAAGAPVRAWPDNNVSGVAAGGSTPYAAVPARAQLLTDEVRDERGLRGFQGNYAIYLSQQVIVTQEDRVRWTDRSTSPPTVRYLDIKGYHNPLRIDELPVIDAWLAV